VKDNFVREAIAEFIGTFMLVFVGAGAVTVVSTQGSSPLAAIVIAAALAHGLILAAIIATFGAFSGAHVNPAVTLGILVGGKISVLKAAAYWIVQFAGGIVAALVLKYIFPSATSLGNTDPASFISNIQVVVIEGVLTFFLTSTVYQADVYGKAGPATPVVIGSTLAACILFGGALTGASLNPARTLGPALVTGDTQYLLWYLIGIFGGGALAGLVHGYVFRPAATS
jgi:MIP family channel proteins